MALYAFDGTWNIRDGKDVLDYTRAPVEGPRDIPRRETVETNVHRFVEFYEGPDYAGEIGSGPNHEYLQGVGTRFGRLGRIFGGAFGIGGRHRIRRMYRALATRYHGGDDRRPDEVIDIVGFSRGAALAVHFANLVDRYEIPHPSGPRHPLWKRYPGLGLTFRHPRLTPRLEAPVLDEATGLGRENHRVVDFLGLFDTVATFGIPVGPLRNAGWFWDVTTIPETVGRVFHAMALDERRKTFELVRPVMAGGEASVIRCYEVWFRGAHSNIGGGYVDRGLSDIALGWMITQARWTWERYGRVEPPGFSEARVSIEPRTKLAIDWQGTRREALIPDAGGRIGRPRKIRRKTPWRQVEDIANVHHSVLMRPDNLVGDYYNVNRPLLRGLPGDAQYKQDPPFFHGDTTRELAASLSSEAFHRIPVFPTEWCRIGGTGPENSVFRSDHWLAQGTSRTDTVRVLSKYDFDLVARLWFGSAGDIDVASVIGELSGRSRGSAEQAPQGFGSPGGTVEWPDAVAWVVEVLEMMWSLLPRGGPGEVLLSAFGTTPATAVTLPAAGPPG